MSITTKGVEEAHCDICKHTWIIHDDSERACPECRRRGSKITHGWKHRFLCIPCRTVWITDYKAGDPEQCPKCKATNEEGKKKAITSDIVNEYACGSCGNVWIGDMIANAEEEYCRKCGCGREEAMEAERNRKRKEERRRMGGGGWTSYRGHTQSRNPETGEYEPSKEEIDAKIATGIWKEPSPMRVMW
jgi:hypothetical protein